MEGMACLKKLATKYAGREPLPRIGQSVPVCRGHHQSKYETLADSSTDEGSFMLQWDRVCCDYRERAAGVLRASIGDAGWNSKNFQANAFEHFWLALRFGFVYAQLPFTWPNGGRHTEV